MEAFDASGRTIRGLSTAYLVRTAEEGAADVAARITILEQPSAGAKQLKLPVVPQGFTVKIAASSLPSVIQTDGTILPPSKETAVTLELEVTRSSDDSKAMTQPLTVHVPGYTPSPGGSGSDGSGGSSNGGSSNSGGQPGSGTPTPGNSSPKPESQKDRSILELKGVADKDGVMQTKVDASVIQEAFEAAPLTGTGLRQVELRQKPVSGASTYEVSLPASALADQGESRVFQIVTELGTLELPATLSTEDLAGHELAKVRLIRMELPKTVADQLGTQHGVRLELVMDGDAWPDTHGLKLHLPYLTMSGPERDRIVALVLNASHVAALLPQSRYDQEKRAVAFPVASAAGNYAAVSVQQKFTDIADVPWAKNALEALAVRDIVDAAENGSERQLHPKQEMTRGQYVQWLITALGLNGASSIPFSDVNTDASYYEAVNAARSLGITDGTGDGQFKPEATITRQEMITLTVRALQVAGFVEPESASTDNLARFRDVSAIRSYARDSVAILADLGIVSGYNGEVKPLAEATRAESAALVYAMMDKLVWPN
ncbi:S-layer homology domain-containing protein [Paenibacillus sp. CC-CFT742]|nr:S-layer homology domain-containing protein [Paenibacillus sp. CC-CFT742]WJH29764.1 S-layer homology domain-containing protein [Paenibacillus sp. CC-CFT742]